MTAPDTPEAPSAHPVPHRIEVAFEVPVTPDVVWRAIATADGIRGWLMPAEVDLVVGGEITFHMGPSPDSDSPATIRAIEPDRRLAYEEDMVALAGRTEGDVTPLRTEFLVESRSGGTCAVTIVTSAYGVGADWEAELFDDIADGWVLMLEALRVYLVRFGDRVATSSWAEARATGTVEQAVGAVRRALGGSRSGDRVTLAGLDGELVKAEEHALLLVLDGEVDGLVTGFAWPDGDEAVVQLLVRAYGDAGAAPADDGVLAAVQPWLAEVLAGVPAAAVDG